MTASAPVFGTRTQDFDASGTLGARPNRAAHLPAGMLLNGRYQVQNVAGEGGMGVVYRVRDALHPERDLALKTIQARALSAERISLFKAEFKTMAEIRHPNIAEVYDFELLQGSSDYLFTLQFVAGRTLLAATESASVEEVVELLVQVCRALSYLHHHKLVHFDIKPANVLVNDQGLVKVLDFGLVGANPGGESFQGTPAYMAPELLSMGGSVDHRADLYSLGIMAYQLLCRRVPFDLSGGFAFLIQQHAQEELRFSETDAWRVPSWLRQIIVQLCAKEPARRFRSANAVIDAINQGGGLGYELETAATRDSYVLSGRFVGRDVERAKILEFVRQRLSGSAGVVPATFVAGVSGVGKSRLMREVRQYVQLSGDAFCEGNCYEDAFSEFGPIVEILAQLARLAYATGGVELIEAYGPALLRLEPSLALPIAVKAEEAASMGRTAIFDAIAEFIFRVSERARFVIYLNDLQWARGGTSEILAHVLRQMARAEKPARFAVLGSYREDEVDGRPLGLLLRNVVVRKETQIIGLSPLAAEHVQDLLSSMLGIDHLPTEFAERVAAETGGNPFFVEEVLRTLFDRGAVSLADGAWKAEASIGELYIPTSITAVFRRRASLLPAEARDILEVMAVHGRPIRPELLAAAMQIDEAKAVQGLRILSQRQMVARRALDDVRFRISHDRMRETVYADITPARQRALHIAIAETVEKRYGDGDDAVYEMAYHYWRAQAQDKALRFTLRAGERAQRAYANELAIELFQRALGLMPAGDPRHLSISESLAETLLLVGKVQEAQDIFQSLLGGATDALVRARIIGKLAVTSLMKGERFDKLSARAWSGLELLGVRRPKRLRWALKREGWYRRLIEVIRWPVEVAKDRATRDQLEALFSAYFGLMQTHLLADLATARLAALRALSVAERLGPGAILCNARSNVSYYNYRPIGDFGTALRYAKQAYSDAEALGSPWHLAETTSNLGRIHLHSCQWRSALEYSEKGYAMLKTYGDMRAIGICGVTKLYALWNLGEVDQARQHAADLTKVVNAPGMALNVATHVTIVGADFENEDEILEMALANRAATRDARLPLTAIWAETGVGRALLARGRWTETIAHLSNAVELRRVGTQGSFDSLCVPLLVFAYARLLDGRNDPTVVGHMKALAREALEISVLVPEFRALALAAAGVEAWHRGRRRRARRFFAKSLAFGKKWGSVRQLADAHHEYGRCLLSESLVSARPELEKAIALYRQCKARPFVAQVEKLLAQAAPSG